MESAWWGSAGGGRHDGHDGVDDGAASCENSADAKGGRVQADEGSADAGDEEISLTLGPIMPRLKRSYQLEYVFTRGQWRGRIFITCDEDAGKIVQANIMWWGDASEVE